MKHVVWALIVTLTIPYNTPANADTVDDVASTLGRYLGSFGASFGKRIARQTVKGTAIDPYRSKPLPLKKPLRECMKKPHVIDDEVIECMKDGQED